MEEIISSTSQGSAILAYGRAGNSRHRLIVWIIAASAICLLGLVFFLSVFETPTVPNDRALVMTLRPNKIASRLSGDMLSDLPAPWRAALQTHTSFPVRLGFRNTASGSIEPFASVPRFLSVGDIPNAKQTSKGFFRIVSVTNVPSVSRDSFFSSLTSLFSSKNQIAWSLNLELLGRIASGDSTIPSNTANAKTWIQGTWTGLEGRFPDMDSTGKQTPTSFESDLLGASFAQNSPEAATTAEALLRRGIDLRRVSSTPSDIHIPSLDETIVDWNQIPESDRRAILAAFGNTGSSFQDLPDATQANVILFPDASQAQALENQTAFHSGEATSTQTRLDSVTCSGNLLFIIRGEIFSRTLQYIRIPASWSDRISGLAIARDGKNVTICVAKR